MTTESAPETGAVRAPRVLVGYDGSPAAAEAITVGASLLPAATAWIAYLWSPPFARPGLFAHLRRRARNLTSCSSSWRWKSGSCCRSTSFPGRRRRS